MDEPRTIADYLKCSITNILQKKKYISQKFDENAFNIGVKQLRIASILLSNEYSVKTVPDELIKAWGSLENVPNYYETIIDIKPTSSVNKSIEWLKDKKKMMYFNCDWNGESIQLPIDILPRIPQAGDFLDLGIYLWRGEELKQTYIPRDEKSFYYVSRVFIGENYVRVDVQRYADYLKETKELHRPLKRRK